MISLDSGSKIDDNKRMEAKKFIQKIGGMAVSKREKKKVLKILLDHIYKLGCLAIDEGQESDTPFKEISKANSFVESKGEFINIQRGGKA